MALTRVHTDLIEGSLGGDASEELQVDTFVGDGTTVTFGLTRLPDHANNTQVYISGVYQQKDTYTVSGLDLTFSEAPAIGESIEAVVAYVNPMYSGDHVKKSGDTMTGDLIVESKVGIGGQTGTLQLGNDGTYHADIEWEYNSNELAFTTNNVGKFTFNSNGSERMSLDDSGVLNVSNGITFGAGTDALDDYEQGTFTPSIIALNGTNPTVTYQTQTGIYTKIGNTVFIFIILDLSSYTGGYNTGMAITGLPFQSNNEFTGTLNTSRTTFARPDGLNSPVQSHNNNPDLGFLTAQNGGGWAWEATDIFTGTSAIRINATYEVA